jgi:hypothetical protein
MREMSVLLLGLVVFAADTMIKGPISESRGTTKKNGQTGVLAKHSEDWDFSFPEKMADCSEEDFLFKAIKRAEELKVLKQYSSSTSRRIGSQELKKADECHIMYFLYLKKLAKHYNLSKINGIRSNKTAEIETKLKVLGVI